MAPGMKCPAVIPALTGDREQLAPSVYGHANKARSDDEHENTVVLNYRTVTCRWRIRNYHLKTATWTVLYPEATFPTLLCHENPAGVTCPPFDNTRHTTGTWRGQGFGTVNRLPIESPCHVFSLKFFNTSLATALPSTAWPASSRCTPSTELGSTISAASRKQSLRASATCRKYGEKFSDSEGSPWHNSRSSSDSARIRGGDMIITLGAASEGPVSLASAILANTSTPRAASNADTPA